MFQVYVIIGLIEFDPSSGAPLRSDLWLLAGLASLPRGVFESLPRLAQLELRDNLLQEPVTRFSGWGSLGATNLNMRLVSILCVYMFHPIYG